LQQRRGQLKHQRRSQEATKDSPMASLLEPVLIVSTAILRKVRLVLCGKTTSALVQTAWHSVICLVEQPAMATRAHTLASVHQDIAHRRCSIVTCDILFLNGCSAASPDVHATLVVCPHLACFALALFRLREIFETVEEFFGLLFCQACFTSRDLLGGLPWINDCALECCGCSCRN
jgi:hypothetical protein